MLEHKTHLLRPQAKRRRVPLASISIGTVEVSRWQSDVREARFGSQIEEWAHLGSNRVGRFAASRRYSSWLL
jgi:hypothetical protein